MAKRTLAHRKRAKSTISLPKRGRVWSIVVGIETYQNRAVGALSPLDCARNDATGFADALHDIYSLHHLDAITNPTARQSGGCLGTHCTVLERSSPQ